MVSPSYREGAFRVPPNVVFFGSPLTKCTGVSNQGPAKDHKVATKCNVTAHCLSNDLPFASGGPVLPRACMPTPSWRPCFKVGYCFKYVPSQLCAQG
eukprot:224692-Pelagomonas_calceolata.AAC.1